MAGLKITHAACASVDVGSFRDLTILLSQKFWKDLMAPKGAENFEFPFLFFAKEFEA